MPDHDRPQQKPSVSLSPYARKCFDALVAGGLADKLSVGGAVALLHYLDYRRTNDVDAWWASAATEYDRSAVIAAVKKALSTFGSIRTRRWGDVVSVELEVESKKVFSFQIAERSVQLESSRVERSIQIQVDSLADVVASKMIALVERGAPRDFRDIHALCTRGLITARECWELWSKREALSGSDADPARATLAVETHLGRIEQHRPLEGIGDAAEKRQAESVRKWFREVFLAEIR